MQLYTFQPVSVIHDTWYDKVYSCKNLRMGRETTRMRTNLRSSEHYKAGG